MSFANSREQITSKAARIRGQTAQQQNIEKSLEINGFRTHGDIAQLGARATNTLNLKQRLKRVASAAVFCTNSNSNPSGMVMAEAISSPVQKILRPPPQNSKIFIWKCIFLLLKVSVAISAKVWYMFVLQGGECMKNELLKDLYDCFYTPLELPAQKQEIEECHQTLIEALDKPERRLVLQIIDAKDRIVEDTSIDSFISGFELAWKLSMELNNYENEHSVSCRTAKKLGARFTFKKEEEQ